MSAKSCDIEITPEMIEAGVNELAGGVAIDLHEGWANSAEEVSAVFRAMFLARPSGQQNPSLMGPELRALK